MRNKVLVFILLFSLFVFSLISIKDGIALYLCRRQFQKAIPASVFDVKGLVVWPGLIKVKNFQIGERSHGTNPGWLLKGGDISVRFSLIRLFRDPLSALQQGHVRILEFSYQDIFLDDTALDFSKDRLGSCLDAQLKIHKVVYQQKEIKDLLSHLVCGRDFVLINDMKAGLLGGEVSGAGRLIKREDLWGSDIRLNLINIQLKDLMDVFGAGRGVEASGGFSGEVAVILEDTRLKDINGLLNSTQGGNFIIKDTSLVDKNLAKDQGSNIVIENLKNYHYDIGKVTIQNEEADVVMDVQLEGRAGRRHLEVVWHGDK